MGLFSDIKSVTDKATAFVKGVAKETGVTEGIKKASDYVDDTVDEVKKAVKGEKGEKQ